jgi:hypothetical protein
MIRYRQMRDREMDTILGIRRLQIMMALAAGKIFWFISKWFVRLMVGTILQKHWN